MTVLLGSKASPFVRRITMLLHSSPLDVETRYVNIFDAKERAEVYEHSPTGRIPVLLTDNGPIWDSLAITRHLLGESEQQISPQEEQQLILINEANDSAVCLFQLRKFEEDPEWQGTLAALHLQRIAAVLTHFAAPARLDGLKEWSATSQWLYCLLDWLDFREVLPWRKTAPLLEQVLETHRERPEVVATDPRVLTSS